MDSNTLFIREVKPQTRRWTVKVQVVEKSNPLTSGLTSRRLQRLLLQDTEETQVQTIIFHSDIHIFKNKLLINKKYLISNVVVRPIEPRQRYVSNEYQWTINGGTLIEETTDNA